MNESLTIIEKVSKKKTPKTVTTKIDEFTKKATQAFDYEFNGTSCFYPYEMPKKIPKEFNIGLIVGASGSGKTNLLKEFGEEEAINWGIEEAIISHFENPEEAINKLSAVGLNSIPSWVKPFHVLSNGEQFRANLARRIKDNATIDEFTSVVDRTVAKATSVATSKHIKKNNIKNVVFASCHNDIIEWLEPDWVFDANEGILYDGRLLRRPKINIEIFSVEKDIWRMFEPHHYLDSKLNKAARCYGALWDGELVGFVAILPLPNGNIKNAWREHRTVILPDYQGMGLGVVLSDTIAEIFLKQGLRFYSRSAHPRFGNHRNNSAKWIETGTSGKLRCGINESIGGHKDNNPNWKYDDKRVCYSHEYVGENYRNKEHFRILFDFQDIHNLKYDEFEKRISRLVCKIKDTKYITFISGKPGVADTFAEVYAKKHQIRQEIYWGEKQWGKLNKICDAVIIVGENSTLFDLATKNNIQVKSIG